MAECHNMTSATLRKFYFQIRSASVIESITAHSMAEAKLIAMQSGWKPWFSEMEWLNPETVTDPAIHD
jgi:hypothetical protein